MVLDHSGLLQYPWVDYHTNPETFVKFAYLIAGCDLEHMGFDPSIFYKEADSGTFERFIKVTSIKPPPLLKEAEAFTKNKIPLLHERTFQIIKLSYREQAVRGSGTFSWDAQEVGATDVVEVTIKDGWRHSERPHEAQLLLEAEGKGVEGVVRLLMAEYEPDDPEKKSSTANARRARPEDMASKDGTPFIDMIHTRIVTERQVPITQFQDHLQLLHALTDAVSGEYFQRSILPSAHCILLSTSLTAGGFDASPPQHQYLYNSSRKARESKRKKRFTRRSIHVGPCTKRSK